MGMSRSIRLLGFLLLGFAALAAAAPPHLVLCLSDDHTLADSSAYGAADLSTPAMERLAREGMTFDRAYVVSPSCAPSRNALLTGLMPARNGSEANHSRIRAGLKRLPAWLKELGYEVVAFGKVGHYKQTAEHGFDHWAHITYHDDVAAERAVEWLRARRDPRPLALLVGTNWPHVPWPDRPEGHDPARIRVPAAHVDSPETRAARARYYAAVTRMDRDLGLVYDAARALLGDRLLFLHSSDHGAQWPFAKWTCYEDGLRTPLQVVWPGHVRPGSRSAALVSWVDILPTLIEAAGGTAPPELDGRSFLPVLRGQASAHRQRIFATHSGDGKMNIYPMRSIRDERWKLILNLHPEFQFSTHIDLAQADTGYWASWERVAAADPAAAAKVRRYRQRPAVELYDLEADPLELRNLAGQPAHAAREQALRGELEAWMQAQGDQRRVPGEPRRLPQ